MKYITDPEYKDLGMKTELNWYKEKKLVNEDAQGIELWTNPHHNRKSVYYTNEQVHKATNEELKEFIKVRNNNKKYKK